MNYFVKCCELVSSSSAGSANLKSQCLNACDKMLGFFFKLEMGVYIQSTHSFRFSPGVHVLQLLRQFAFKTGLLFVNCKSHRLSCNEEWDVLIQTKKIIIIIISIIIFISVCYSIVWLSQKTTVLYRSPQTEI